VAIKNGQSRETGNIGHTRHRTKINKTQKHNATQKTRTMTNMNPTKKHSTEN